MRHRGRRRQYNVGQGRQPAPERDVRRLLRLEHRLLRVRPPVRREQNAPGLRAAVRRDGRKHRRARRRRILRDPRQRNVPRPHPRTRPYRRPPQMPHHPPAPDQPGPHDLCPHGAFRQPVRLAGLHRGRSRVGRVRHQGITAGTVLRAGRRGPPQERLHLPRHRHQPHGLGVEAPGGASRLVRAEGRRHLCFARRVGRHLGRPDRTRPQEPAPCGATWRTSS